MLIWLQHVVVNTLEELGMLNNEFYFKQLNSSIINSCQIGTQLSSPIQIHEQLKNKMFFI